MRWIVLVLLGLGSASASAHPLDPLTAEEITAASAAVRTDARFGKDARFASIALLEPPKREVLAAQAGGAAPARRALVVTLDARRGRTAEVRVALASRAIEAVREVPGQPSILIGEYDHVTDLVRADPRWQAAMKKRGLTDWKTLYLDAWAPGLLSEAERASGHRYMRAITFWKGERQNYYGHPVEGVIATIDLTADRVVAVVDAGPRPLNRGDEDFGRAIAAAKAALLRPLAIAMPHGASFTVDHGLVRWQGFSFREALDPQKGLVIYDLAFEERPGVRRPILYKGGVSEMVVPYGDPDPAWVFRNAFDVGEYGLGRSAHTLERGLDVPEHAALFDAVYADDLGAPVRLPAATAIYERDGGVLWKHVEQGQRKGAGRRARELVVTFTTTIGNYDYGLEWILHEDGVIDVQVFLTGILLAKGSELAKNPCDKACQRLVAPHVLAPNHQHFFSFRLDLDVDGAEDNALVETDVRALPAGPANPAGNGFEAVQTPIASEQGARRDVEPARSWKVQSRRARNPLDHPTGYALHPGATSRPFLAASSPIRQRARFVDHALWATRYRDGEQNAAGDYPNQSKGGEGLPAFQADDEALDHADVVLWYTLGVTHVPRPEEWPIMNAQRAGFSLMPVNFFARNPALTPR